MTARLYLSRALRRQKEGGRERKEKDDGTIVANQGRNTMGERGDGMWLSCLPKKWDCRTITKLPKEGITKLVNLRSL